MRLAQFIADSGDRKVGLVTSGGTELRVMKDTTDTRALALEAGRQNTGLESVVESRLSRETLDFDALIANRRILPPLDHPDPAHCLVTGTGLTHLGSAQARDSMHAVDQRQADETTTDSMRLFQWGVAGGKPVEGKVSVQPEWFYKGNGHCVVPPEYPIASPPFALDGGEEAELVGLYVIADDGAVLRLGFSLGNEFSDHVMERQNYLYLAHSKLRPCSFGPELLVGELPSHIEGQVKILRDGAQLWEDTFLTGEDNMSYDIANLEYHHFKYEAFRQPGDVHCHFFGAATLSVSAGIRTQPGDVMEVSAPMFGKPLRNTISQTTEMDSRAVCQPL